MKSENTIELNGHLYDSVSGKMLSSDAAPRPKNGGNIDGFFRTRTKPSARPAAQKTVVIDQVQSVAKPAVKAARASINHTKAHTPQVSRRTISSDANPVKVHSVTHPKQHQITVNHTKARKQQASATLMRTAVTRPAPSFKQQVNVQSALTHNVPSLIQVKHVASAIDTGRLVRASSTETSPLVAHHGKEVPQVSPILAPLHVQPVPVKPQEEVPVAAPAPQQGNNPPENKPQDIFNHALTNAANFLDVKEHRTNFRRQTRTHVVSMTAGIMALFVITIFAVYQNSPGLQFKVASVRAGVATSMPNLKAAGFAYQSVHAANGKLSVGFANNTGSYRLTQQNTSWSSDDMISEISSVNASGHANYTTVNGGDTTIYRFSNTTATWVSNGKWYSLTGTSSLSNDQLKQLVQNV